MKKRKWIHVSRFRFFKKLYLEIGSTRQFM